MVVAGLCRLALLGKYKFMDFVRFGRPLTRLYRGLGSCLIPFI